MFPLLCFKHHPGSAQFSPPKPRNSRHVQKTRETDPVPGLGLDTGARLRTGPDRPTTGEGLVRSRVDRWVGRWDRSDETVGGVAMVAMVNEWSTSTSLSKKTTHGQELCQMQPAADS